MENLSKINRETAEHYLWGEGCDGWHYFKSDPLSVIRERMPAGTTEQLHYHKQARQVFFILSGRAIFETPKGELVAETDEAVHFAPGTPHSMRNDGPDDLHFLLISTPSTRGDRYEL